MKRLLVVGLALVLLTSCGGEPEVDWSAVPANQRTLIEAAVEAGDCAKMQTYFDAISDADVLSYLDWHMDDAGCY